jgi:hypothetical protein
MATGPPSLPVLLVVLGHSAFDGTATAQTAPKRPEPTGVGDERVGRPLDPSLASSGRIARPGPGQIRHLGLLSACGGRRPCRSWLVAVTVAADSPL